MSQIEINNTINSVNVESTFNTVDVNNDISNVLVIPQQITNVVEIITPGPQGPPGPLAIFDSGSYVTTSSFNAFTASYNTGSFLGSFTGSLFGTSSYTLIASQSQNSISASYALTASYLEGYISPFPYTGSAIITGSLEVIGNQTIRGNLIVQGTTTTISSSVLEISDQFILLASGSLTDIDGGIIIQSSTNGLGHAFGYAAPENRWVLQSSLSNLSTSFGTIDGYMNSTQYGSQSALPANPSYGGATYGYGNMYITTDTEEIFIWV